MLEIGANDRGRWEVAVSDEPKSVPAYALRLMREMLREWQEVFPREETYAVRTFGVPSILIRIDCTLRYGRIPAFYEVEERPAGAGVVSLVCPDFKERLARLRDEWPPFAFVTSSLRRSGDDYLWLPELSIPEARERGEALLLIRAEPAEAEFHPFAPRSVSTVCTKGMKSYGLALGFWKTVRFGDVSADEQGLPWEEGFAVKPTQGSKCRNVHVWDPRGRLNGAGSTRRQIMKALEEEGEMCLQPFLEPMHWDVEGKAYDGIFRIFFGWNPNPRVRDWVPLGGCWNARPAPATRIHGAKDALSGPLILEGE